MLLREDATLNKEMEQLLVRSAETMQEVAMAVMEEVTIEFICSWNTVKKPRLKRQSTTMRTWTGINIWR